MGFRRLEVLQSAIDLRPVGSACCKQAVIDDREVWGFEKYLRSILAVEGGKSLDVQKDLVDE